MTTRRAAPYLSTGGRIGYALACSAFLICFDVVFTLFLVNHPFDVRDILILSVGLIACAVGVALVQRDPIARQQRWRFWIFGYPFGPGVMSVGLVLTIGGLLFLGSMLISLPRTTYYSFEASLPYVLVALAVYLAGWILLIFGNKLKKTK